MITMIMPPVVEVKLACITELNACDVRSHMGQFLQGGKNRCFVSLFFFTESLRVAKPYKIKLIFQLILVDWVFRIVKTS